MNLQPWEDHYSSLDKFEQAEYDSLSTFVTNYINEQLSWGLGEDLEGIETLG